MLHFAALILPLSLPLICHAAGDAAAGKSLFQRRCASCHQVGPSARAAFGPHLNGIVGRQAGNTPDYPYSPAMKATRLVWTPENLRAFIRSPDDVVPGNKMRFWGIGNERQLQDLLAYLHQLR
ncbi:cytochrome c [Cupriavidus gilardii J11]|uniref:Cytochrome c n=1 Tax=Cupriavidus gilardii J11 TaxID=936133 RepID=A0A562BVG5_9BURK|nr:cytochrome c family protein [Cupriavidus gilardii]TWG89306.1 cytochrome c [Cupriavidus gilardii J11]